ncbi:ParB family chromosome partitioning protein [Peptoniphilus koenoeneniae]|uniref:ParB family chromosome partitioning protein n=1 Tax=Peptoniphilus koenoeneniae TaxID=507751 RepID=A0ABU0AV89_9FIRM|nr:MULTISPECIES: ParB/RepB/Spo0J family partition protein [Peptoniphilus]ERT60905.1 ParB-like protein [Peptoniphilus sp. BV3C26]MDQ0275176.1 ParB family chromosome partitioning protein [Peptoniphilus koenoeneniae]
MVKKRGLGRGIENFLTNNSEEIIEDIINIKEETNQDFENFYEENNLDEKNKNEDLENNSSLREVELDKIEVNEDQPRQFFDMDSLMELADSIREYGIIQPIVLRPKENYYIIVAGERRFRASKLAGLKKIPAIIKDLDDFQSDKIAIIENVQRKDLTAFEEARGYEKLLEEYDMTQEDLAKLMGKSRQYIGNRIRLLKLPQEVKDMINTGKLSLSHGLILLSIEDPQRQVKEARRIANKRITIAQFIGGTKDSKDKGPEIAEDKYLKDLRERLSGALGTKVSIKGKGKIKKLEVEFYSDEDLERISNVILGDEIY